MSISLNMKLENMCRTCLQIPETVLSLIENQELLDKIKIISSVEIQIEDELPLWICQECIENVNTSFDFRNVIINSDVELKRRYALFKQLEENSHEVNFCDKKNDKDSNNDSFPVSTESIFVENNSPKPITEELNEEEKEKDDENSYDSKNDSCLFYNEIDFDEDDSLKSIMDKFDDKEKDSENTCVYPSSSKSTGKKLYVCTECDYECTAFSEWRIHKKAHPKINICNFCGKIVPSAYFSMHIRHHTGKPVKCFYCDKMFKNSQSIRHHLKGHKSEIYQCEICEQNFNNKDNYNTHKKRRHTDETKVKCKICGKILAEKKRIKLHMRSHTGERPYVCEFCNKGFTTSYARNVHKRLHTNEKPYKCKYCSAAFRINVSLRKHIESDHKNSAEFS